MKKILIIVCGVFVVGIIVAGIVSICSMSYEYINPIYNIDDGIEGKEYNV